MCDAPKGAREGEVDVFKKAEAVLKGAAGSVKTSWRDIPDDMWRSQMLSSAHVSFSEGEDVREEFREGGAGRQVQT